MANGGSSAKWLKVRYKNIIIVVVVKLLKPQHVFLSQISHPKDLNLKGKKICIQFYAMLKIKGNGTHSGEENLLRKIKLKKITQNTWQTHRRRFVTSISFDFWFFKPIFLWAFFDIKIYINLYYKLTNLIYGSSYIHS